MASAEEAGIRKMVEAWGRERFVGARVVHEVVLGDRRIDMAFVAEKNIVGVEIKSSLDTLDRLEGQVREFQRWLPEVWLAAAAKWKGHDHLRCVRRNLLLVNGSVLEPEFKDGKKPYRDELVCSRMLALLWRSEAARICNRTGVIPGTSPSRSTPRYMMLPMLARLLTGNDILREVCFELRRRPLVGYLSDKPLEDL